MRKKVDPHTAVSATSSAVATVPVWREVTGARGYAACQTIVRVTVEPLRAMVPAAGLDARTVPKNPPRTLV